MRNIILTLPILALSACSVIDQPHVEYKTVADSGQYSQGCASGACAPGQGYSVANSSYDGVNSNHWPDNALVPNYESGGADRQAPFLGSPQASSLGHNVCAPKATTRYGTPALRRNNCGIF